MSTHRWLALAAKSDGHLTGDQEVAGSVFARYGNILSWRLIMNFFSVVSLTLQLIQEVQLSVSGKEYAQILVKCLED